MAHYAYKDVVYRDDFQHLVDTFKDRHGVEIDDNANYDGDYWVVAGELLDFKDEKIASLEAIIEQAKAEQDKTSEPVAIVSNAVSMHTITGKYNTINICLPAGTKLYTAPQPTPQDVIDAERWRYFVEYGLPHMELGQTPEEVIDQAMKGE